MRRLFTRTFFHFLTAFLIILALSFMLLVYIGSLKDSPEHTVDAAETSR